MIRICLAGAVVSLLLIFLMTGLLMAVENRLSDAVFAISPFGARYNAGEPDLSRPIYRNGEPGDVLPEEVLRLERWRSVIVTGAFLACMGLFASVALAALTVVKRLLVGLYWFYRGIRSGGRRVVTPQLDLPPGPGRMGAGEQPPAYGGDGWQPGYPPQDLRFGPAGTGLPPEPGL